MITLCMVICRNSGLALLEPKVLIVAPPKCATIENAVN